MLKISGFQYNALWVVLLIAVPVCQLLAISLHFDAYVIVLRDTVEGWRSIFGYTGQLAKVLVLFLFILLLLMKDRLPLYWDELVRNYEAKRAFYWLIPQLVSFAMFFQLSRVIFDENAKGLGANYYLLWLVFGLTCVMLSMLTVASLAFWRTLLRSEALSLLVAISVAVVVWMIANFASNLWGPLSEMTFLLVAIQLSFFESEELYVDFDEKVVGIGDFAVNIAPACSGYEGMGLIIAFTAIYLYLYKTEFRFPRALILFPIGALVIWLLNSVRISALVLIGAHLSPEVAIGGFHSQAGWLTFIGTSLLLLWLAKKVSFLTIPSPLATATASPLDVPSQRGKHLGEGSDADLAIATLVPLVVLLAVILLTSAFSAGFDWAYPLRVVAVVAALYWARRELGFMVLKPYFKPSIEAILAGIAVAVIWIFMLGGTAEQSNTEFESALWSIDLFVAWAWLLFRFVGSVITVPIAEELAFRAYLLCKLSNQPVQIRGRLPLSILAVVLSSLAFGALHGAWVAGTIAGIAYAIVRLRSDRIGDAIFAHALTNLLLFVYAFASGEWVLI